MKSLIPNILENLKKYHKLKGGIILKRKTTNKKILKSIEPMANIHGNQDNEKESSALLMLINFSNKIFYKHFLVDTNRNGKGLTSVISNVNLEYQSNLGILRQCM